jgi:hypothetical protein
MNDGCWTGRRRDTRSKHADADGVCAQRGARLFAAARTRCSARRASLRLRSLPHTRTEVLLLSTAQARPLGITSFRATSGQST